MSPLLVPASHLRWFLTNKGEKEHGWYLLVKLPISIIHIKRVAAFIINQNTDPVM